MTAFRYTSLPTPTSVRLITLLPGHLESPLSCCINVTNLESGELYEALSYEWGSNTETFPLSCCEDQPSLNNPEQSAELPVADHGHFSSITIRSNLREALLRLRYSEKPRRLWIDAICINQEDNAEKSIQVGRMKEIYNKASLVVAWLGKGDDTMDEAMDAACLIHRYFLKNVDGEPRLQRSDEFSCRNGIHYRDVPQTQPTVEVWEKAGKLLRCSYFSRLWIVQEIVVAHRAQVVCGAFSVDFRCLRDFMVAAFDYTMTLQGPTWAFMDNYLGGDGMAVLSLQYDMRSGNSDETELGDLAWLLWRTRDSKCADPRDKVFALLNISSKYPKPFLRADYDMDLSSVYIAAARTAVQKTLSEADMCLNLFEQITTEDSGDLPSWVPDWRISNSREIRIRGARRFDATGMGRYYSRELFLDFAPPDCLHVRGVRVSEVLTIAPEDINDESHRELDFSQSFQLACTIAINEKYPCTRQPIREAFFRTRLADSVVRDDNEGHSLNFKFTDDGSMVKGDKSGSSFIVIEPNLVFDIRLRSTSHLFFIADKNMMGLCPTTALPGDFVYIIIGCGTPLLLRPGRDGSTFRVVGVCYLHGFMDGEWIRELAIDAKSRDEEYEYMDFDGFFVEWTDDRQILQWTDSIALV